MKGNMPTCCDGKHKAIAKINSDKNLEKELEPILAKERFAQIVMDITYDVSVIRSKKFFDSQLWPCCKSKQPKHRLINYGIYR